MNGPNAAEIPLNDHTKFILNKINKIKDYFNSEIQERKTMSKNLKIFKTRLGFKQHDPIMAQEQSILSKAMTVFATEKIILQHSVLGYRIYAYFPKYKLAIEVDDQGHNSRDIDYEIERQKALKKELGCKFIRINSARENFSIFVEIGKIQNYIVKSIKK